MLQYSRIGVLGYERSAQQFQTFFRYFLDDGRLIHEPPAAKGHQVAEFSRVDAQLMLIFAAQDTDQEAIVGELHAEAFKSTQVGFTGRITREPNRGIHLVTRPDHQ